MCDRTLDEDGRGELVRGHGAVQPRFVAAGAVAHGLGGEVFNLTAARRDIRARLHERELRLQAAHVGDVVGVHSGEIATPRGCARTLERGDDARRLLSNDPHPRIPASPVRENGGGVVRGTVVDDHDLEVIEALRNQRVQCFVKKVPTVADGEEHTHSGAGRRHPRIGASQAIPARGPPTDASAKHPPSRSPPSPPAPG